MIMLKENLYYKERQAQIDTLCKELDALEHDYKIVKDEVCKFKIKTFFEQKQSRLLKILKEEEYGNWKNVGEESGGNTQDK